MLRSRTTRQQQHDDDTRSSPTPCIIISDGTAQHGTGTNTTNIHIRRQRRRQRVRRHTLSHILLSLVIVTLFFTYISNSSNNSNNDVAAGNGNNNNNDTNKQNNNNNIEHQKEYQYEQTQKQIHTDTTTTTTTAPPPPIITPTNKIPIIHIINTRFMQHQPTLKILAKARLYLFKTFCLPSIINQTNQNFIWIIKIDPHLDVDIRNELIHLIQQPHHSNSNSNSNSNGNGNRNNFPDNIFVIGSNDNYMPGAWRGEESINILQKNLNNHIDDNGHSVYTGNINLLRTYIDRGKITTTRTRTTTTTTALNENEHEHIILETRLDADDGLNKYYIDLIQKDATQRIFYNDDTTTSASASTSTSTSTSITTTRIKQKTKWYFWCIQKHAKWYPGDDVNNKKGSVSGERRLEFCITPGLTVGFNAGTRSDEVPVYDHHLLYRNLVSSADCNAKECLTFVTKMIGAVRSRTNTSAGMADTVYKTTLKMESDMESWIWNKLEVEFGISINDVIDTNAFLQKYTKEIAKENLEGQCTHGHSCKKESKDRLGRLIS